MIARATHPVAWWLWALLLGAAVLRIHNPFLLGVVVAVTWFVVVSRRPELPWSRSFGAFIKLGVAIMVIRLLFQIAFGARVPGTVLFTTPSIELPQWLAGVSIGGSVTTGSLLAGFYDGLQLAVLLACMGAANSLASPYRLLRCVPGVLYEAGVALTVAFTFVPSAAASVRAVRDARRLRGRPNRGVAGMRGLAIPVLESALDRSLQLAASMDSRGYGRSGLVASSRRVLSTVGMLGGLAAVLVGLYGLLSIGTPGAIGLPLLAVGAVVMTLTLFTGSAGTVRTRYRPDPWRLPEWITVLSSGIALATIVVVGRVNVVALSPVTEPVTWPSVPVGAVIGLLVAVAPAFATPEHP